MKTKDCLLLEKAYQKIEDIKYFKYFAENFVLIDDKSEKVSLEYILEAKDFHRWGRFCVKAHGKNWEVEKTSKSLRKNVEFYNKLLFIESPDVIVGAKSGKRYKRTDYTDRCILFASNINGDVFYFAKVSDIGSHNILFRKIYDTLKEGKPFDDTISVVGNSLPNFISLEKFRKCLDHNYSGCIFQKKDDGSENDLDGSYVSIWSDKPSYDYIKNLRIFYSRFDLKPPLYFEYLTGGLDNGSSNEHEQILIEDENS